MGQAGRAHSRTSLTEQGAAPGTAPGAAWLPLCSPVPTTLYSSSVSKQEKLCRDLSDHRAGALLWLFFLDWRVGALSVLAFCSTESLNF